MLPARLCDRCLGRRLVGAAGVEAQQAAGAAWRAEQGWPPVEDVACPVCEGRWDVDVWLRCALDALEGYSFTTFQVGTRFPALCERTEKEAAEAMGQEPGETIRTEANRLLAQQVAAATGAAAVADGRPDIVVHVDTRFWTADARANPVFVAGRYTKHRRDLPQTHWPCKTCQGRGCFACQGRGVQYEDSVEDFVCKPLAEAFGATAWSFHGAGREDIDALMLGSGRPFVAELHDPRLREGDLEAAAAVIAARREATGVGVDGLRHAAKAEVAAIKEAGYDKAYIAHCETEGDVPREAVEGMCAAIEGAVLEQRTPDRVSHRRADLVRRRKVHELRLHAWRGPRSFSLFVLAESGTYIKELVSGDEGRTTPNVAVALGVPCRVVALDVMGILDPASADPDASDGPAGEEE